MCVGIVMLWLSMCVVVVSAWRLILCLTCRFWRLMGFSVRRLTLVLNLRLGVGP